MKLASFRFSLPSKLIASAPPSSRENARLMVVYRATGKIEHTTVDKLPKYFGPGDAMVLNDSKILPSKLHGNKEKTKAAIEVLLLSKLNGEGHVWDTLIEPARKIRVGNKLYFGFHELVAEVMDNTTSRGRTIKFNFDGPQEYLDEIMDHLGTPALPHQMGTAKGVDHKKRCQTVFATTPGSITPLAGGLHLTRYLIKYMELQGVTFPTVTLHNSYYSFDPLETEDLRKYKAITEYYKVPEHSIHPINQAIEGDKRVCAVDLSALKALECSISSRGHAVPKEGWSNLFFHPPYTPTIANALLTNFYPPQSTAFINTSAFGGYDLVKEAYRIAIKKGYRFLIYGDALLLL